MGTPRQTKGPSGRKLQKTAPTGGLDGGDLVIIRSGTSGACGVVVDDVDAGESAIVEYGHQVYLPKLTGTGEDWSQGDLLYRDASTGSLTPNSTGNTLAGAATEAATTSATFGWVQLGALA